MLNIVIYLILPSLVVIVGPHLIHVEFPEDQFLRYSSCKHRIVHLKRRSIMLSSVEQIHKCSQEMSTE